ncbi:MAG: hypothetical protein M5U34_32350 [Chloroflexi bacterium]|nr:hypothetical protein [Chloroflexota bacterium]
MLMVSVIYKKRALPLAWVVVRGSKGHFPEETHCQLVQVVKPLLPEDSDIIFLGDGEFDGNQLQQKSPTMVGTMLAARPRTAW